VSYRLKDSKTEEEFLVLLYCKSLHDKFNRSDLPGAIKDAIYSVSHIQELQLHQVETITEAEYEAQNAKGNNPLE
jgi:hypothetical protein